MGDISAVDGGKLVEFSPAPTYRFFFPRKRIDLPLPSARCVDPNQRLSTFSSFDTPSTYVRIRGCFPERARKTIHFMPRLHETGKARAGRKKGRNENRLVDMRRSSWKIGMDGSRTGRRQAFFLIAIFESRATRSLEWVRFELEPLSRALRPTFVDFKYSLFDVNRFQMIGGICHVGNSSKLF